MTKSMTQKLTPQQAYEQERAAYLAITEFPIENIPSGFREKLHRCLIFNNIRRLNCHKETWRNFVIMDRPFRCAEIDLAIEVIKAATPFELKEASKFSDEEVFEMLKDNLADIETFVEPLMSAYDVIDRKMSTKIKAEINTKLKITQGVPVDKKLFLDEA